MKHVLVVSIFATAFLSISEVALAQSSVTLYGLIDSAVSYSSHASKTGGDVFAVGNGAIAPNRWGIRFSEDIGNQARVIGNLEAGFNIADGSDAQSGRQFGRTSIVGLESVYGTLTLGREYTVLYEATALNDVYRVSNSPMVGFVIGNYTASTRLDNGIKYQNKFGPVSVGVEHNFAGTSSLPQGTSNGARLAYDHGPLHIGAAYQTLNNKTSFFGVTVPSTNQKTWTLGGTYEFSRDKLFVYYTHSQLAGYFDQLASVGLSHEFAPDLRWLSDATVDYMTRQSRSGNRFNLSTELNYSLSKQTSTYILVDYTELTGAWRSFASLSSFTNSFYGASNRVEVMAGILHRF